MGYLQTYLNPQISTVLTRKCERNLQQHRNILIQKHSTTINSSSYRARFTTYARWKAGCEIY